MPRHFERFCKRGHDKLHPSFGFIVQTRTTNGRVYTILMCKQCQYNGRNRRVGRVLKRIDNKHSVTDTGTIIKTSNGAPIPDHEPKILFRGRDKFAIPMMQFYLELCMRDGCTPYQEESMRAMIREFEDFKVKFPSTMKQPGSTSGR